MACIVGGISMTVFGSLLNWFYIFPTFLKMFCGGNMEALVGMGSAVNPLIKDIPTDAAKDAQKTQDNDKETKPTPKKKN